MTTLVEEMAAVLTDAAPIITRLAEQQRQERGGSMEGPECNTGEYLLHLRIKAALARHRAQSSEPAMSEAGWRITVYGIEEDEEYLYLNIGGLNFGSFLADSEQGVALLKLDAALRSALPPPPASHGE